MGTRSSSGVEPECSVTVIVHMEVDMDMMQPCELDNVVEISTKGLVVLSLE